MIITEKDFPKLQKKVVMVDGGFDPLHVGHVRYFTEAARSGFPVLCNLRCDDYLLQEKGRPPLVPDAKRAELIDAFKAIQYVYICRTSTADTLKRLKPLQYIKGADWKKRGLPPEQIRICDEEGIEIVYLETMFDSSSNVAEAFTRDLARRYSSEALKKFEDFVFSQKKILPGHYDQEYFSGDWRAGNNKYSLEARRAIEAKNPENIKKVFNPQRVLDMGCGPGALMYFLWELGVESWGIDYSEAAKKMAPPEVRERIVTHPVTEFFDFGKPFDLVICREMMEHLTVLEIREAVRTIARYTSKFLYLTTRFIPSPKTLLDVGTDQATDPSHITVMTKDFLRSLFVLEGLHSRYDLEEALDWKKYGRVLVFERL